MAILFDAEKKIFKLDTASSSYVFAVHDSGRLLHLYYGAYLPDCDMRYLLDRGYFGSFTPDAAGYVGTEFSPDTQPSEYSCNGTGRFPHLRTPNPQRGRQYRDRHPPTFRTAF